MPQLAPTEDAPLLEMPLVEAPRIVHTAVQPTAFVHLTIPRAAMMREFDPSVKEVLARVKAQGMAPAGPLFAHHLQTPGEMFDFELGFPVARAIEPAGRVQAGEIPAQRWLRTVYTGPFDGLPGAWGVFHQWLLAKGLPYAEDFWEVYLTKPQEQPDATLLRTELNRVLRD